MTIRVGIFVFDEVEVLDFAGPFEVFLTAARMRNRDEPDQPILFEVLLIAESQGPVRARGGLLVTPHDWIDHHPTLDVLVVPGGVVDAEMQQPKVVAWIQKTAASAALTASVCTGAFLLGKAGLLDGLSVTTHWEDLPDLQRMFPLVQAQAGVRWVDTGRVVTAAGISAGIDMSLHLVSRLAGRELAVRTARQMEYDWTGPQQ